MYKGKEQENVPQMPFMSFFSKAISAALQQSPRVPALLHPVEEIAIATRAPQESGHGYALKCVTQVELKV